MIFSAFMMIYIAMLMIASCYVFDRVGKRLGHGRAYIATALFIVSGMIPVYLVNHWWGY